VHSDKVEQVFSTLSYVDVVNHAKRATAPALFSVALTDDITPASTVFAAYNHYGHGQLLGGARCEAQSGVGGRGLGDLDHRGCRVDADEFGRLRAAGGQPAPCSMQAPRPSGAGRI